MKLSKIIKVTIIGLFLIVVVSLFFASLNPLRRSEEVILQALLQELPLGSSRDEVRTMIQRKQWEVLQDRDSGYRGPGFGAKGTKVIEAVIGEYHEIPIPFQTLVVVFWGFDDNEKLIDVNLRKETDGP